MERPPLGYYNVNYCYTDKYKIVYKGMFISIILTDLSLTSINKNISAIRVRVCAKTIQIFQRVKEK